MADIFDTLSGTVKKASNGKTVVQVAYTDCDYTPDGYDNETCLINGVEVVIESAGRPFGYKTEQQVYLYVADSDAHKLDLVIVGGTGGSVGWCNKCQSNCYGDCQANA